MATTSISSNIGDVSSYCSRMVTITVTGIHQQSMRLAQQTISVSYSRLSQTIRNIHRDGGKIVDVSIRAMDSERLAAVANDIAAKSIAEVADTPVVTEHATVISASASIEDVAHAEPQKQAVSGRSKQQNSSHASKKKKK